jgi:DNA polymerase III delta' subunit
LAFEDIAGNSRVKKILQKSLQIGKLPNSLLFVGPPGVGKIEFAEVVAKALNCREKEDDSCEKCESCLIINKGNSPDVLRLVPEKDTIKIEQIRELKKMAYLKPMVGKKRVFIIEDAEKMTQNSANSLLKILEEPPFFSYIVLITSNPFLIIPTIRSRCQVLTFSPVSKEEIKTELMKQGYNEEDADFISLHAKGNLKRALILDGKEIEEKKEQSWKLFLALLQGEDAALCLKEFGFRQKTVFGEDLIQILEALSSFLRDILLLKEKGDIRHLMNPEYEEKIKNAGDSMSHQQTFDFLTRMDSALYAVQRNVNINLLMSSIFSDLMEEKYA